MQDWNELRVFKEIAAEGSLIRAATNLSIPRSTVSKRLADLEGRLGHALFKRTTRKVSLTTAGRLLLDSVTRAFETLEAGAVALADERGAGTELVIISAPPVLAQNVVGLIAGELIRRDPGLVIEVRSVVDHVPEAAGDVDIRLSAHPTGKPPTGSILVGHSRREIYVAPSRRASHGMPSAPDEISPRDLVMRQPAESLVLLRGRKRVTITCDGRLRCVDHETVRDAAIAGAAYGVLPKFVAAPAVSQGTLVQVLPEWRFPDIPIAATIAAFAKARPAVRQVVQLLPGALERAGLSG